MRAAGQDHGGGLQALEGGFSGLERHNFGVYAGLAHAPRYELRHLAAEIYN
jgi:hypothetical protein